MKPGWDVVAVPGRGAVAVPADGLRERAVTARRSDGTANWRNNAGWRCSLLFVAHVTMPR
jgi:hypothetical protein